MWGRVAYIVGCVLIPVIWGVLVNLAFDAWRARQLQREEQAESDGTRNPPRDADDSVFPDYQI